MIRYASVGDVARWCGVPQPTVSKWLERFPTKVPQPDSVTGLEREEDDKNRRLFHLGWLPEREGAWLLFSAGIRDGSVSGYVDIDAAEAVLAEAAMRAEALAEAEQLGEGALEVLG
jgi:hypothetical protein